MLFYGTKKEELHKYKLLSVCQENGFILMEFDHNGLMISVF